MRRSQLGNELLAETARETDAAFERIAPADDHSAAPSAPTGAIRLARGSSPKPAVAGKPTARVRARPASRPAPSSESIDLRSLVARHSRRPTTAPASQGELRELALAAGIPPKPTAPAPTRTNGGVLLAFGLVLLFAGVAVAWLAVADTSLLSAIHRIAPASPSRVSQPLAEVRIVEPLPAGALPISEPLAVEAEQAADEPAPPVHVTHAQRRLAADAIATRGIEPSAPQPPVIPGPSAPPSPPRLEAAGQPGVDCDAVACLAEPARACCAGRARAEGAESTDTGVATRDPGLPEQPSREQIRIGFARIAGRLESCGDKHGERGVATVRVTIGPDGDVTATTASRGSDAFRACLETVAAKAEFAPSASGASIAYPVVLR
jgi:hypothetical protein